MNDIGYVRVREVCEKEKCAASFPSFGKMGMGDLGIGEMGHSPVTDSLIAELSPERYWWDQEPEDGVCVCVCVLGG